MAESGYANSSVTATLTVSDTGVRQRAHSAVTGAVTVPDTSTPSTTDSSRRSSISGSPARTLAMPTDEVGRRRRVDPKSTHRPRSTAQFAHVEHEGPAGVEAGRRPGGRRRSGWHVSFLEDRLGRGPVLDRCQGYPRPGRYVEAA